MRYGFLVCGLAAIFQIQTSALAADISAVDQDRQRAQKLAAYLKTDFPDQITCISIEADHMRIEGRLGDKAQGLQLAEVPMWEDVTAIKSPPTLLNVDVGAEGHFAATVDRRSGDRDRLLSAWAIVKKSGDRFELLSALHYVDTLKPRAELPAAKPKSIKGLCGCPFDHPDMQTLGVASATLNIILNEIIHKRPGAGRSPYTYCGHTWYTADAAVARYDHEMKLAADHGWMISAIILVAPIGNSPAGTWIRDAADPDADPKGAYVMPNFTSRAGVEAYAAGMNFLAERYSRPDGEFGRIHDWIMHNEVSSGYYWTTAGDKSPITYLDRYQKSMRLAWLITHQYDGNAKPLISLDHCWTKNPDPRGYAARELLERLVDFSRKEGDFAWGLAFHPYAQDLFNPRTWEDTQATATLDTPLITLKNIEQLDAWVRQPQFCFRGKEPREIQLTEQGLNSRDYGEKSFAEQAAGLAYAWKKITPLKTITAFQYHHWSDAREEGGLRLGLRKFADEPGDPLGKKLSWSVFCALGTDQEEAATAFAKPIIGIKEWSEVREAESGK